MINIFHGDNNTASRNEYNKLLDSFKGDVLRLDSKQIDLNKINNFLEGSSLFADKKMLGISNFFSIPKANADKLIKIFNNTKTDIAIWQEKKLNPTQQKTFPKAKLNCFELEKIIYTLLNQIKPHNLKNFILQLRLVQKTEPFDLIFFWIKFNIRRQLTNYSKLSEQSLKKAYLQLIDLDYFNKTGELIISREIALIRIMSPLLN